MFKKSKGKGNSMFNNKALLGSMFILAGLLIISATISAALYPNMFNKEYSAVSTVTGEFYVGKAFSWPFSSTVKLTDVFALQNVRSSSDDADNLQLIPLTNSLWQPSSISFNKENIVFSGKVSGTSQIAETIRQYRLGTVAPQNNAVPVE